MEKIKKAEDLKTRGKFKQCIEYAIEGLSVAEEMGNKEEIAKACEVLCDSYYEVNEYEKSIGFGKRSLDIAKTVGDKRQEALLYFNVAWSYYDAGDYKQSQEYGKQAVSIAKELGNKELEAEACHLLAWSCKEVVDYEQSKKYGQQSLSIAKEVRNEKLEAKACQFLAWLYYEMTEHKHSKDYGKQSLRIAKKIRNRDLEVDVCHVLAWSCHKSGDYEESKEYGNQFLNIAVEVGNKELEAKACHVLSWSYHMIGDGLLSREEERRWEWTKTTAHDFGIDSYSLALSRKSTKEYIQSQSYSRRSLRIAQVVGNRELQAEALCALAWSLYRVRDFTESIKYCKQLLKIARKVQNKELEAEACLLLGCSYNLTNKFLRSEEYSEHSLRIAKAVKNKKLEKEACIVRYLSSKLSHTVTEEMEDELKILLDDSEEEVSEYSMSVPEEVIARGPRAKLAYENALKTGKVKVYRARIMLIGQDRAGKTSLKKSFLGLPFDPEEESTDGIEVDPSKFEVDIDQVKNWKRTDEKLGVSQFASDLAKMVAMELQEIDDEAEEENDEENDEEKELEEMLGDERLTEALFDAFRKLQDQETNLEPLIQEKPALFKSQGTFGEAVEKERNTVVPTGLKIDPSLPPEEFTDHLVQLLGSLNLESVTTTVEDHMTLDLWDFAGQHLYYASCPVFLSTRAVYMLVYDLSKKLNDTAQPCFKQGIRKILLSNPNKETNLENLLSWLVSLNTMYSLKPEVNDKKTKVENLPYCRPPVFIVGTHADKSHQDIKEVELQIQQEISGKGYERHVIRPFFSVDNTQGSADEGVVALQKQMIDVLKQEPYMGEEVPIRWFNFEKVVKALIAEKVYYLNLEQLQDIIQKVCFIEDEDEVTTMLDFYHDLGIIVRHRSTVILQAQWLIEVFRQLITIRSFNEMEPRHSQLWKEMETTGALHMELVDHVFSKRCQQQGLIKEDILNMMEQFGLIVKFITSPTNEMYFVPCQLKTPPEFLCEMELSPSDPCPLYLHFKWGFVPHGLFCQLVSRCTRWYSESGFKETPHFFDGAARFFIGKRSFHQFILLRRKRFIKIILTQPKGIHLAVSQASFAKTNGMAILVRTFLEETLQILIRELSWLRNLKCDLCVACPGCLRHEQLCSIHEQKCCTHEDCLCLLKVERGVPRHCQERLERPTLPGLEKWFSLEDVSADEEAQISNRSERKVSFYSPQLSKRIKYTDTASYQAEVTVTLLDNDDLPTKSSPWDDGLLPTDMLLLTVEDCEFLSCLSCLNFSFCKSYRKYLGYVYFGDIGEGEMKLRIAVMKCCRGSITAGGSAVSVLAAVRVLRPKAVFLVGVCHSLKSSKVKLGDVVISEKLITCVPSSGQFGDKVPLKSLPLRMIPNAGDGWKAPLKDPKALEVKIHRGDFLSVPGEIDNKECRETLIRRFPQAVAMELEGQGLHAAAHDLDVPWIIIKGISDFKDGRKPGTDCWKKFASLMAASLTVHILSDPMVFRDWPHYTETCEQYNKLLANHGMQ